MKLNRDTKLSLAALAMIVVVATTIAAVPGIFSSVNSTSGYQVAGSAGSSGNALCSDGTYYDLPCSVAGGFTAAGDLSGTSSSQNVIGVQTHTLPSLAAGSLTWNGSAWVYASPGGDASGTLASMTIVGLKGNALPSLTAGSLNWNGTAWVFLASTNRTCNSNGCYKIANDGTIEEWGVSPGFGSAVEGTVTVSFPHNFTTISNLVMVSSATTCNDTGGACGSGIHPYTCTPETTNTLSTAGVTMFWDGNGSTVQTGACGWHAWGN